jgi:hypothetical protein
MHRSMIGIKRKTANFDGQNNKPQPLSGWGLRQDCSPSAAVHGTAGGGCRPSRELVLPKRGKNAKTRGTSGVIEGIRDDGK